MVDKVPISDFAKLDLRVGLIKKAEEHPNATKLFVLTVDLGEKEDRTIVAGLRNHYSANELEGKQAIFVANLEPVVLRGVESNGMILAASDEGKENLAILLPEKEMNPGNKIG